jgi:hypothetical protein
VGFIMYASFTMGFDLIGVLKWKAKIATL